MVLSNHFTSTYPESWFTWQPIVARRYPDADPRPGRPDLHHHHPWPRQEPHATLTDEEFATSLSDVFGLTFTDEELATLVAAPRGAG